MPFSISKKSPAARNAKSPPPHTLNQDSGANPSPAASASTFTAPIAPPNNAAPANATGGRVLDSVSLLFAAAPVIGMFMTDLKMRTLAQLADRGDLMALVDLGEMAVDGDLYALEILSRRIDQPNVLAMLLDINEHTPLLDQDLLQQAVPPLPEQYSVPLEYAYDLYRLSLLMNANAHRALAQMDLSFFANNPALPTEDAYILIQAWRWGNPEAENILRSRLNLGNFIAEIHPHAASGETHALTCIRTLHGLGVSWATDALIQMAPEQWEVIPDLIETANQRTTHAGRTHWLTPSQRTALQKIEINDLWRRALESGEALACLVELANLGHPNAQRSLQEWEPFILHHGDQTLRSQAERLLMLAEAGFTRSHRYLAMLDLSALVQRYPDIQASDTIPELLSRFISLGIQGEQAGMLLTRYFCERNITDFSKLSPIEQAHFIRHVNEGWEAVSPDTKALFQVTRIAGIEGNAGVPLSFLRSLSEGRELGYQNRLLDLDQEREQVKREYRIIRKGAH